MKDNKKIITTIIISVVIILASLGAFWVFTSEDANTTLTILEKQWIESNKNKVYDLAITDNVPVFNVEGEGLFFDFLTSFENATKLSLNKIVYDGSSNPDSSYSFKIVDKATDKDILIYQDHFVLVTNNKIRYNSLNEIKDLNIGVMQNNMESVSNYLSGSTNLTYKPFMTVEELINSLNTTDKSLDAIVLPLNINLKEIISNPNFNIAYHITEMTQDYVLSLANIDNLNTILKKYYKKWSNANYETSFNNHLTSNYFDYSGIDEQAQVNFRSKRYSYGFITNVPYDYEYRNRLMGINNNVLKGFSNLANIEISFKNYNTIETLTNDFNSNNIDLFYGNNATLEYKMDVYQTISIFNPSAVILSHTNNNVTINSLKSLIDKEVMVVANSKIAEVLTNNGVKTKTYNSLSKLLSSKKENSIMAIDTNSYEFYLKNKLSNYNVDYKFDLLSGSNYVIRDIEENKVFENFFNFYLSITNTNNLKNNAFVDLYNTQNKNNIIVSLFIIGSYLAFITTIFIWVRTIVLKKKNSKIKTLSKADKLKYIDILTSLKNRNYLNDNIEKWDENDIYPQSIIIIDLNNIAYINDNYGHEEGDNVIREAANILISNQVSNSDIVRTNGNEFLIYMVGYEEKQVVAHIRKLNKELKELNHNFGAAIGYSMIVDAIKTIDDAVNEATLDMRNNKEETNN